jgi:hypothetical protein
VIRGLRKLHNEELHDLDSSSNIIRMIRWRMRWSGHIPYVGQIGNAYTIFVRKTEEEIALGRPTY